MVTPRVVSEDDVRDLLRSASGQADCRRRRVGAVLVATCGSVHGLGWNALPEGSCTAGECPRGLRTYDDVPASSDYTGNCVARHAETRAIAAAGVHALGGTMYITDEPCPGCQAAMRRENITWVVLSQTDSQPQPVGTTA